MCEYRFILLRFTKSEINTTSASVPQVSLPALQYLHVAYKNRVSFRPNNTVSPQCLARPEDYQEPVIVDSPPKYQHTTWPLDPADSAKLDHRGLKDLRVHRKTSTGQNEGLNAGLLHWAWFTIFQTLAGPSGAPRNS